MAVNPLSLGWRVLVPTAATLEGGIWDLGITWGVEKLLRVDPRLRMGSPQGRITLCKNIPRLRVATGWEGEGKTGGTHGEGRHLMLVFWPCLLYHE